MAYFDKALLESDFEPVFSKAERTYILQDWMIERCIDGVTICGYR